MLKVFIDNILASLIRIARLILAGSAWVMWFEMLILITNIHGMCFFFFVNLWLGSKFSSAYFRIWALHFLVPKSKMGHWSCSRKSYYWVWKFHEKVKKRKFELRYGLSCAFSNFFVVQVENLIKAINCIHTFKGLGRACLRRTASCAHSSMLQSSSNISSHGWRVREGFEQFSQC